MDKKAIKERSVVRHSFLQGALVLTIAMAVVKVVGALFKIPLANVITPNGMGYFNTAYLIYGVIFSLATAGFPIAIARLVAENYSLGRFNDVRQVKRISMPIFLTTGSLGTLIMLLCAKFYTEQVGNPGAFLPVLALAPSVLFCCLASIYRGYYEGLRNMYPTAISEVIESLAKLIIGLSAALGIVYYCNAEFTASGTLFGVVMDANQAVLATYSYAAAAAISGVTIGSMCSWLYLVVYHRLRGDGITKEMYRAAPKPHSGKSVARKLVSIAIPIAIGSLFMSLAGLIDTTLLLQRLQDSMTNGSQVILNMYRGLLPPENLADLSSIPNFLYGCYTNGLVIFMLVPAVTQAFGVSALPNLTEAWTKQNKAEIKTGMESILRITALFCFPAGLGITALAEPISTLLYGTGGDAQIVGRVLIILGIGAIFAALGTPVSSMLQAVGKVSLPVIFVMVGLVIKITVNYFLCVVPEVNILGAGTGTLVCYFLVTIAEIMALVKVTKIKINWKSTFIKPFLCAFLCAASAFGASVLVNYLGLGMKLACVVGIVVAVPVYAVSLLFSKSITKMDVISLPKGEKIAKLLEKHGWIG